MMKISLQKRLTVLLLMAFFACVGIASPVAADEAQDYKQKAALVLNLARFTVWPEKHIRSESEELYLCVFGDETVQKSFRYLDNKVLGKRIFSVSPLESPMDAEYCDVLFFSGKDGVLFNQIMMAIGESPTLTIGEMSGFTEMGGIINMVKKDSNIEFEIDPRNVRKAGLSVSSRLLKLSTILDG